MSKLVVSVILLYVIPTSILTTSGLKSSIRHFLCLLCPMEVPHAGVAVFPSMEELKNIEVTSVLIIIAKIYDSTIYLQGLHPNHYLLCALI